MLIHFNQFILYSIPHTTTFQLTKKNPFFIIFLKHNQFIRIKYLLNISQIKSTDITPYIFYDLQFPLKFLLNNDIYLFDYHFPNLVNIILKINNYYHHAH